MTAHLQQQDTAAQDLYLDGATDAATGASPASTDAAYLDGYLEQLRALILTSPCTLQIRWLSDSYLCQAYDSPEEF
jgi:hypothetical protein